MLLDGSISHYKILSLTKVVAEVVVIDENSNTRSNSVKLHHKSKK